MEANAKPLLSLFESKVRYEVPLFQRPYVWDESEHWEPLWEDIQRKARDFLDGRVDRPAHFLGAMVLDQKRTPATDVVRRLVIDGQQRMTTIQIILRALHDYALQNGAPEVADELREYIHNKGMMQDPKVDRFKVWPTEADREQFSAVMTLGELKAIKKALPRRPVPGTKYRKVRPLMVRAYEYFLTQFDDLLTDDEQAAWPTDSSERVAATFRALRDGLKVVVVDLDTSDDAQIIFETLNARGSPLLPADLLRNYAFLRAEREDGGRTHEEIGELYNEYWRAFDDDFWREIIKQGRLKRPRSDLFMQHFLASRRLVDVPVNHLYVEYRYWIEREQPFASVEEELQALARNRDHFHRILRPGVDDPIRRLVELLDVFDIRTAYPLLLRLLEAEVSNDQWEGMTDALESFIVRRTILGRTTKAYNRFFLSAVKYLELNGYSADTLRAYLASSKGQSGDWPQDSEVREALMAMPLYRRIPRARLRYVLLRLNEKVSSGKSEILVLGDDLTIEHALPQTWHEHYPLKDGRKGLSPTVLERAPAEDPLAVETRRVDASVHVLGNLGLLTQPLNSSVSNGPWDQKSREIEAHSLLPLNRDMIQAPDWTIERITERGQRLANHAIQLWHRPILLTVEED